jgi:hypothetical protein
VDGLASRPVYHVEAINEPARRRLQGEYRIPPERQRWEVGDLSFWLTPLRSGMSETRIASYYVVVRHNRLRIHPKRVVAFIYCPGTRLRWI